MRDDAAILARVQVELSGQFLLVAAHTQVAETVVVMGKPSKADLEACWNVGATVAATLMG